MNNRYKLHIGYILIIRKWIGKIKRGYNRTTNTTGYCRIELGVIWVPGMINGYCVGFYTADLIYTIILHG